MGQQSGIFALERPSGQGMFPKRSKIGAVSGLPVARPRCAKREAIVARSYRE